MFSDSSIHFTTSEGDGTNIDGLKILGIGTGAAPSTTTLVLEESPDKTNSIWDFSKMQLNNISAILGLELDDTITGSAGTDVILGGNGNDTIYGGKGDDCIDGGKQNNDLYGGDGKDVFVLTGAGYDTIHGFNILEDVIVNVSGVTAKVKGNTVYLGNGKNAKPYMETVDGDNPTLTVVVNEDISNLVTDYPQCSGYPK